MSHKWVTHKHRTIFLSLVLLVRKVLTSNWLGNTMSFRNPLYFMRRLSGFWLCSLERFLLLNISTCTLMYQRNARWFPRDVCCLRAFQVFNLCFLIGSKRARCRWLAHSEHRCRIYIWYVCGFWKHFSRYVEISVTTSITVADIPVGIHVHDMFVVQSHGIVC